MTEKEDTRSGEAVDRARDSFREKWQEAERLCGIACAERDDAELKLGRLREALGKGEADAVYLTDYDRQMIAAYLTPQHSGDHACFDCGHPVNQHSGQVEATGCRVCSCKRWFDVHSASHSGDDQQVERRDTRVQVVAQIIAGHVTTDDEMQQDFCEAVARDVLKALDQPSEFPPSHFAHRFQEDGWPR